MDSVDVSSEKESPAKVVSSDQTHNEEAKMNGETNGSHGEDSLNKSEGAEESAESSPSFESHTNGELTSQVVESHENGVEVDEAEDDSVEDEEEGVVDEGRGDEERVESEGDPLFDDDEEEVGEEDPQVAAVTTELVLDEGNQLDGDDASFDDPDKTEVNTPHEDVAVDNTDDPPTVDVQDEEETSKSIISNIRGVDSSTPLSKELEDLSKIGARGSLEITLVKKDADRSKEDGIDRASEPAILTITDASSKIIHVDRTPKGMDDNEKDDEGDSPADLSSDRNSSKKKKSQSLNVTPRRSSRNLNKSRSYADKDSFPEGYDKRSAAEGDDYDEDDDLDDDVQEVVPTDPLAPEEHKVKKTTIVVSDTKKLVEIAAGSKQNRATGKKVPTLVIIDTNSILSGKGPVPVSSALPQMSITSTGGRSSSASSQQQQFMRPLNSSNLSFTAKPALVQPAPPPKPPTILPSLTDDMYVVEAPSFIVPYVYEKPPVTPLKEFVTDLEKVIKEREKEERIRKKAEREKRRKEDEEKMVVDGEAAAEDDDQKKLDDDDDDKKSDTETDDEGKDSDSSSKKDSDIVEIVGDGTRKKSENYFDNPLGKFFMQIGVNLVQEHVQTDLLRNQKRKRDKDEKNCPPEVHKAINSLLKTLEYSKENNKPYKLELQKCKLCNFKTESALVMAHHLETPHMRNYVYRCNFCTLEVRSPHDILLHMESSHNVRGRLERAPAFHQCPNCPFEDGQKGKLSRHLLSCAKKYKPERNQEPPLDWEPPAKIPRVKGARPGGLPGSPLYNPAAFVPRGGVPSLGRMPTAGGGGHSLLAHRGRGRPPIYINRGGVPLDGRQSPHHKTLGQVRPGMVFRPSGTNSQQQVLIPSGYNSLYQKGNSAALSAGVSAGATAKLLQQPSISITPLPRQPIAPAPSSTGPINTFGSAASQNSPHAAKPGRPASGSKTTFVICEICDGYIKDLEQLRNHMQWIHKVKIHPKMIYNRPPLNCQKCQFRFFTDQGLERHLLGSHGLVTSSMQEASNKGKDGGRCPVCGRVYQWKLLNHVGRDHNMVLKPAHLSYKCTVCTATFGMYKQFESHVYSAHSVVAKRVMDKKNSPHSAQQPSTSSTNQSDSMLKPLKINDEITIIPQPARAKTKSQTPLQPKPAKVIEF